MSATLTATVGHGSSALWYLTRATGLVSLVLLSATVVLGLVTSVGWTTERWPRFVSQSLHRNLSLLCLAVLAVHIVSTVGDGYVPIGLADAVIPFRSPYRPIWVGLGALAFDMLVAVAITSALRRRIGTRAWRGVHWLAYACWPIAAVHGLGSGSDARLPGAALVFATCVGAVALAVAWRLVAGRARSASWRAGAALAAVATLAVMAGFALAGPFRPGWSHRAGTSQALLAQLAGSASASYTNGSTPPSTAAPRTVTPPASGSGIPATPFVTSVSGTVTTSAPNANGDSQVSLSLRLANTSTPLSVQITGPAENGGVAMRRSSATFGPLSGTVTALDGSNVGVVVSGPSGSLSLTLELSIDGAAGTVQGQASGTAVR